MATRKQKTALSCLQDTIPQAKQYLINGTRDYFEKILLTQSQISNHNANHTKRIKIPVPHDHKMPEQKCKEHDEAI